jgi:5-hydroxyisourate hydrolase
MSAVTTHVLDTAAGRPAAGVPVRLESVTDGEVLAEATTDADGRVGDLGPDRLPEGPYRLTFYTAAYFGRTGATGFYPQVCVTFLVVNTSEHFHVPLLLSPYGYSTYRGS